MRTLTAAAVTIATNGYPVWVKNTARVAFLLLFIKAAAWVAASWLALRGFHSL